MNVRYACDPCQVGWVLPFGEDAYWVCGEPGRVMNNPTPGAPPFGVMVAAVAGNTHRQYDASAVRG